MRTVARFIAERLKDYGVEDVFMVTGGGSMHLNDAFSSVEGLKVTYFHHEQAAAMAAESYYRLIRKPVVLNVTTGPGAINAINGVYGAYVDSCSIFVVSGQVKLDTFKGVNNNSIRQLGDQEVDIISMINGIVKKSYFIDNPSKVPEIIESAIFVSEDGRPGPVWLDIPLDVSSKMIIDNYLVKQKSDLNRNFNKNKKNPIYLDGKILALFDLLNNSRSPSILLGNGIHFSNSREIIIELLDKLSIPVLTGWNAHDVFTTSNNLFCGKPGTVGDRGGNIVLHNSDLLIVLGSRLNIRQISYNYHQLSEGRKIVYVDIDQSELEKKTVQADLKICTDLNFFIEKMIIESKDYKPKKIHQDFLAWSKKIYLKYRDYNEKTTIRNRLNPYFLMQYFFNKIGHSETIITGNGTACVVAFQTAIIHRNTRLFTNSGSASMGYDIPAAIGASIANKNSRVILITGDGSIMQNIQELELIKYHNLSIKIIVLNNRGYSSIKQTQTNFFPDNQHGYDESNGISFPDFVKVANAFGLRALKIETLDEWEKFLKEDILLDGPILADVMISDNVEFHPKLASYRDQNGVLVTPKYNMMTPILSDIEIFNDEE